MLLCTHSNFVCRSSKLTYKKRGHPRASKSTKPTIPVSYTKQQFQLFAKKKLTKEAAEVLVKK